MDETFFFPFFPVCNLKHVQSVNMTVFTSTSRVMRLQIIKELPEALPIEVYHISK